MTAGSSRAGPGEAGHHAGHAVQQRVVTFARTGDEAVGCFLVDPSTEGYEVVERVTTMGHRASETVTVAFDEVAVGGEALVGDPARGFVYALESLVLGRVGIAAQALGVAQASLDHSTRYSRERKQFGRALSDFGATQAKLAEMAARIAGARAATHEVGRRLHTHRSALRLPLAKQTGDFAAISGLPGANRHRQGEMPDPPSSR